MSNTSMPGPKIQRLASVIESDVRRRGLVAGDAYLTSVQASKDFGVDTFTATRAMSLLAERGILVRKRGVGTFVGERLDTSQIDSTLKYIHILQGSSPSEPRWCFPIGQLLQALHGELPSYPVQSTILPMENPLLLARKLIETHANDGKLAGMLLVRCNRDVQQLVLDHHIPAVIFGCVYPTTRDLVSVDIDHFETGRLAAQRLLASGHRRVMALMRENWLAGDNLFVEGIISAMSEVGAGIGALVTRSTAEEVSFVENEIHRLLEMENRPTGLICLSGRFAEIALGVLRAKGLNAPEDLEIVFNSYDSSIATELGLPCICPELSSQSQSALAAQALSEQVKQGTSETKHVTLNAKLFEPKP